jgi:integron integrase
MAAPNDDKQGNPPGPRLLDEVRNRIRTKHYSRRTEESYTYWIKRFILFHHKRHPREMGAPEVEAFLSSLAVDRQVAASTQRQALAAILFLYKEVLVVDLPWLDGITRAKERVRVPVVLSRLEVERVLTLLHGTHGLMARLLYGSGMRLMECLRLRVKDVDFERHELTMREGKGGKDRVTMLPTSIAAPLRENLKRVHALFEADRAAYVPGVFMPDALAGAAL